MDRKNKNKNNTKKTRGVFEASVVEISHHRGLQSPKHSINYSSKENLIWTERDCQALEPALYFGAWGLGLGWQPGFPGRKRRNRSVARWDMGHTHRSLPPPFPGPCVGVCDMLANDSREAAEHLCFQRWAACFREHLVPLSGWTA